MRPKDADSEATHDNILKAAMEELGELAHPSKLSMRRVAARSNLSVGAIQYYFGSKEELLENCLNSYYETIGNLVAEFSQRLMATEPSPKASRELIEESARAFYRFLRANPALVHLRVNTRAQRGELHPRRQAEFMGDFLQGAAHVLAPHVKTGVTDTRMVISAVTATFLRFSLMTNGEAERVTGLLGDEATTRLEEFAVRAAWQMLRATDAV